MSENGNQLRGAVAARFGSCEALARAIGWSGRKTRAIVSRRQVPTARDIMELARALGVENDPEAFMTIFFEQPVHNVD